MRKIEIPEDHIHHVYSSVSLNADQTMQIARSMWRQLLKIAKANPIEDLLFPKYAGNPKCCETCPVAKFLNTNVRFRKNEFMIHVGRNNSEFVERLPNTTGRKYQLLFMIKHPEKVRQFIEAFDASSELGIDSQHLYGEDNESVG